MPNNRVIAYGFISLMSFAVAALAIWRFWPDILERLEQRPWPPQLSELADSLESGDTYTLQWQPATTGPNGVTRWSFWGHHAYGNRSSATT